MARPHRAPGHGAGHPFRAVHRYPKPTCGGRENLSGWYVKPADWYSDHDVELRTGSTVRQVDTALKQLQLESGVTLDYDKLVFCTSQRNRSPMVPGATLPGIYQLRTLAECDNIRQVARPGAHVVIVGMGTHTDQRSPLRYADWTSRSPSSSLVRHRWAQSSETRLPPCSQRFMASMKSTW